MAGLGCGLGCTLAGLWWRRRWGNCGATYKWTLPLPVLSFVLKLLTIVCEKENVNFFNDLVISHDPEIALSQSYDCIMLHVAKLSCRQIFWLILLYQPITIITTILTIHCIFSQNVESVEFISWQTNQPLTNDDWSIVYVYVHFCCLYSSLCNLQGGPKKSKPLWLIVI